MVAFSDDDFSAEDSRAHASEGGAGSKRDDSQQAWGGDLDRLLRQLVEKLSSVRAESASSGAVGAALGAYDANLLPVVIPHQPSNARLDGKGFKKLQGLFSSLFQGATAYGACAGRFIFGILRDREARIGPLAPPTAIFLAGMLAGSVATISAHRAQGTRFVASGEGGSVVEDAVALSSSAGSRLSRYSFLAPDIAPLPTVEAKETKGPIDLSHAGAGLDVAIGKAPRAVAPQAAASFKDVPHRSTAADGVKRNPVAKPSSASQSTQRVSSPAAARRSSKAAVVAREENKRGPLGGRVEKTAGQGEARKYGYAGDYGVEEVFSTVGKKINSLVQR